MSYQCPHCGNNFTTIHNLRAHQQQAKYCLRLQGKHTDRYNCECGKSYTTLRSLTRHKKSCRPEGGGPPEEEPPEGGDPQGATLGTSVEETAIQIILDKIEEMARNMTAVSQKVDKIDERVNRVPADGSRNNVVMNMNPVTDEKLKEHLEHLSLDFATQGAKGYATYIKLYPLKDDIICTDKARSKLCYKNADGKPSRDSRSLARRFFSAIAEKNTTMLEGAYKEIREELREVIHEKTNQDKITDLLTRSTNVQEILINTQNAANGGADEFVDDFIKHLAKML